MATDPHAVEHNALIDIANELDAALMRPVFSLRMARANPRAASSRARQINAARKIEVAVRKAAKRFEEEAHRAHPAE